MITSCPRCESNNLKRQTGDDEPTSHYGRLVCGDCGSFVKWLRDSDVSIIYLTRQESIDSMLESQKLNQWERSFLQNIYEKRSLSPKQQAKYEEVYKRVSPVVNTTRDKESADC